MDSIEVLKDRVTAAVKRTSYYSLAERLSNPSAAPGTRNPAMVDKCLEWSQEVAKTLEAEGLEVLFLCLSKGRPLASHVFLMVRDPESGAVVYYDPSGEQCGVIGAHKRAFTRQEVCAFNEQHGTRWLDKPILFSNSDIRPSWRDDWPGFEALQKKWGAEIHYDVPATTRIEQARSTVKPSATR